MVTKLLGQEKYKYGKFLPLQRWSGAQIPPRYTPILIFLSRPIVSERCFRTRDPLLSKLNRSLRSVCVKRQNIPIQCYVNAARQKGWKKSWQEDNRRDTW